MLLPPIDTFFDIQTKPQFISCNLPTTFDKNIIEISATTKKSNIKKEDKQVANIESIIKDKKDVKIGMKFTEYEDNCLRCLVQQYGTKDWFVISKIIGTKSPRECKDRWEGFIHPKMTNRLWTLEEDMLLAKIYGEIGPKWKKISSFFEGRTDSSVRNRWNYLIKDIKRRRYL